MYDIYSLKYFSRCQEIVENNQNKIEIAESLRKVRKPLSYLTAIEKRIRITCVIREWNYLHMDTDREGQNGKKRDHNQRHDNRYSVSYDL